MKRNSLTGRERTDSVNSIQEKKKQEQDMLRQSSEELYHSIRRKRKAEHGRKKNTEFSALEDILKYYGMEAPEIPSHLGEESEFSYILRRTGLLMRRITLEGTWWKETGLPILVSDDQGEEYALLPDKGGHYLSMRSGKPERLRKEEREKLQEVAFCFYKPLDMEETGLGYFWKFLLKNLSRQDVILICAISLLLELCGMILPYINSVVYNVVIPSGTAREIPGIIVLVLSSVIFSTLIGLARSLCVTRIGSKMQVIGQSAVWNRLFQLPAPFFKKYDSGEIYNRANAVDEICQILGGGLIPTALTALLSVIYLVQISAFAQNLVLSSLIIVALLLANILVASYLQIRQSQRSNEVNNQVTSVMYQLVNGITKIRTAGAEVRAFRVWSQVWKNTPVVSNFYLQLTDVLGTVISLGGSIVLYWMAWKSNLTASDYIAFQTSFSVFSLSVLALADFGHQLGCLKPAVEMLRPILEEQPELYGDREYVDKLQGGIEISNVEFRYTQEMPYVLNGLNLQIKPGEYLGIVGSSGCGKSTLMRLLLGFETPESGSVYYDGKDISSLDLPSLRRRIGVVLQNGSLFAGDIFSNLSICAPRLTMEEAWDAADRAGVADDIEQMPMGMFTMLSEDGGGISGGQKQRILIARAIAAKPDILLFDEATSALDNQTQATVVQTLKEMDCTRLVIAHRLSTIRDCDRIIYLDKGQIVESGSYEELMSRNGRFAQMAARQLAN